MGIISSWCRRGHLSDCPLRNKFERIDLHQPSIMVRALLENQAQLVTDVRADPDYFDISEGTTRSELAVVMRREATRERQR